MDCELLAKVYINLLDQKEPKLEFNNSDIAPSEILKNKVLYFKKIIKPTSDEIKRHNDYLKKELKKNFFN